MLCLRQLPRCTHNLRIRVALSRQLSAKPAQTDELGIPLKPTWSVHAFLSSYPSPKIAPETLKKLYDLSALVPPKEGTEAHAKVTKELEEMIRLVEAVKLVNTDGVKVQAGLEGEDLDRKLYGNPEEQRALHGEQGRELLKHASWTVGEDYVVESDRTRGTSAN
ncbi:hypothetical protein CC1G_00126 [Coprinopsis cinerea okayama7|uniref:Glutamyl-tRNA amidotransferase complex subunit Gta3 domain-containing protein n=1 Tax=Coprinopsis cinerea (strain Okayama-7 / 130 / ATCC MYA-4618 / FGSC 9003) TaxID=240176 RepID=A8NWU8_COPC7|nr:hypothetical protein CC1G_00126 [Coprinopsis cinerea okayama7\|eukprot:XP_001836990.1 hypothetical protein CC1G_00126 [Coprinopsis cinerea okayama7\